MAKHSRSMLTDRPEVGPCLGSCFRQNLQLSICLAVLLLPSFASAQAVRPEPRIGYLYPAGACRGATIEILAGGQMLNGVKEVRISGKGVTGRIIKTYRPVRNLDGDQRKLFQWHIACRRAGLDGKPKPPAPKPPPNPDGTPAPEVKLPDMPLLDLLENLDSRGIRHWMTVMERKDRMQQNNQLGETVRVEIRVARDAPAGMRELRFGGPNGFTNPVAFEISGLTEIVESEPNEPDSSASAETPAAAATPCVFNGQVQAGDVDIFRFRARRGEDLVVRGRARALIPYLADAVPGWFQMVVTVRDPKGREVAYGDDFRFDPDPALCFRVPEDGDYTLEVRDSIHRGREDFVYRVQVGALPFISHVFPLGGQAGTPTTVEVRGWNLPAPNAPLDTAAGGPPIKTLRLHGRHGPSNDIPYAVDTVPEDIEHETGNNSEALPATVPRIVNGRIGKPGDVDIYQINARKGEDLAIDIQARRLRSPLDAVIHVADEHGRVLAWNDDLMEKDGHLHLGDGLLTHHADPRVRLKVPADGPLFIRVADTQGHGGADHAYRLRMVHTRPEFELRVTPSVVNTAAGGHVPVRVHVLRNDGFDGEIRLGLKDAPEGVRLAGARVPPGVTQIRTTLFIPPRQQPGLFAPVLTGTATDGGVPVTREAAPADDAMQAFLWRHLVPAKEWLVCVAPGRGRRTPVDFAASAPLRLAAGATTEVRVTVPKWIVDRGLEPEPSEAPPGITFSNCRPVAQGIAFEIAADSSVKPGFETNLIIDLFATLQPADKPGLPPKRQPRSLMISLPALPILITPPATP